MADSGRRKRKTPSASKSDRESGAATTRKASDSAFPIVGIGGSAGGFEALQTFFSLMSASSGAAFVLVQHLDPDHKTMMPELLSKVTPMSVTQVEDSTRVKPNHVYIIPPNTTLTIEGDVLHLKPPSERRGFRSPIDDFFNSLAQNSGRQAVAIVLSGTGSDGTLGLRAIKEHGGVAMAQDPASAKYDTMPRNAIATGVVDFVLPSEHLPGKLFECIRYLDQLESDEAQVGERDKNFTLKVCSILKARTGHDFSRYKQSTLLRRIQRRMQVTHPASQDDYLRILRKEPSEAEQLLQDLLIGVTQFFRDSAAYDALGTKVVPMIIEEAVTTGTDEIRVWVPACSTGEEAYSLAMLLHGELTTHGKRLGIKIFATDVDERAIQVARRGRYPSGISKHVPSRYLKQYFNQTDDGYQVVPGIRELCLFSPHSILRDPPFSRLDLISCRNLLIYLENELQDRMIPLFHYALRPRGYLFLGTSEGIGKHTELFKALDKKQRIFRARDHVQSHQVEFPLEPLRVVRSPLPSFPKAGRDESQLEERARKVILERFGPAAVVVTEDGKVVYYMGETSRYLKQPTGSPKTDLLSLARKGLRVDLRTSFHKAISSRQEVSRECKLIDDGTIQRCRLTVRPMPEPGDENFLYIVIFEDIPTAGTEVVDVSGEDSHDPVIQQLDQELRTTREQLQSTIEELETSNEELKSSNEELLSMNEELQSSNEELQTSKEELQSVNEELQTVNSELSEKILELDQANSDLRNLFDSTEIATLFLDKDLNIKRFTPAAKDVFHLVDSDIGRPISHISARFPDEALADEVRSVLRTLKPTERKICVDDDRWYLLRVLPYRTLDDRINGAIINFVDIHDLVSAQEQASRLAEIVESSQDAVIGKTLEGIITSWNRGAEKMYGYAAEKAIGQPIEIIIPEERRGEIRPVYERLRKGETVEAFETERMSKDGTRLQVLLSISGIRDIKGKVIGVSAIAHDISKLKEAERALRESEERFRTMADAAPVLIWTMDARNELDWANRTWLDFRGKTLNSELGARWMRGVHAEDRDEVKEALDRARTECAQFRTEFRFRNGDRKYRWMLAQGTPRLDPRGESLGMIGSSIDISDQREIEQSLLMSKEKYRALISALTSVVWTTDSSGRFRVPQPSWAKYTGQGWEEYKDGGWLQAIHPEDRAALKREWKSAVAEARPYENEGRIYCAATKSFRWFESRAIPLFHEDGSVREWIGVVTDIHTEKEALRKLETVVSLERAARQEAEKANQTKDEFLSMVSHELRTPLTSLMGWAHMLRTEDLSTEERTRALEIIHASAVTQSSLIDEILDGSRMIRGELEYQPQPLDLRKTVVKAVEMMKPQAVAAEIDLEARIGAKGARIDGDPRRIEQIVLNLLSNAIKFSERGGKVEISLTANDGEVTLQVRDQGIGISPEFLPHVFEKFRQQDQTSRRRYGGLGLGLALVKYLTEAHHGNVRAHSEGKGTGATFEVTLPLSAHKKKVKRSGNGNGDERKDDLLRGKRVLIVDDDEPSLELMARLVSSRGADVETATTTAQALDFLRAETFDLLVSDIGLNDQSGYELIEEVRRDKRRRNARVPAIALTAYATRDDRQRALEAGFDRHVAKPIDPEHFINEASRTID